MKYKKGNKKMTKSTFTKKDYDNLLKYIQDYHETASITSSIDATQLIIKGILTGKLVIKMVK